MITPAERATDWPKTVEEAVHTLLSSMPESEKRALEALPVDELPACRHGLGVWVRNTFGLWCGNGELLRSCAEESARRERAALGRLSVAELEDLQRRYERALARLRAAGMPGRLGAIQAEWYERAVKAGPEELRGLLTAGPGDDPAGAEGVFLPPGAASWVIVASAWERLRGELEDGLWLPWRG